MVNFKTEKLILLGQLNKEHKEIPTNRRVVKISSEIGNKIRNANHFKNIIREISMRSENGKDLNRYLHDHKRELDFHLFNEKFLNATGFYHLHMSLYPIIGDIVQRSSYWLFVYPTPKILYLIDIMPHSEWKPVHLYEVILRNWPSLMKSHCMISTSNDMTEPIRNMSDAEAWSAIRLGSLNVCVPLSDGNVYRMFGFIMTDGSSGQALRQHDQILDKFQS
jgi:hypothetical protein